jgi:hypothetical protein
MSDNSSSKRPESAYRKHAERSLREMREAAEQRIDARLEVDQKMHADVEEHKARLEAGAEAAYEMFKRRLFQQAPYSRFDQLVYEHLASVSYKELEPVQKHYWQGLLTAGQRAYDDLNYTPELVQETAAQRFFSGKAKLAEELPPKHHPDYVPDAKGKSQLADYVDNWRTIYGPVDEWQPTAGKDCESCRSDYDRRDNGRMCCCRLRCSNPGCLASPREEES